MRTFTVMTCRRAEAVTGSAPRAYGYTIVMNPPREITITGDDVEGIGWVPFDPPRRRVQHWRGWYKHKATAEQRAAEARRE